MRQITRRRFVRGGLAVGAALALPTRSLFATNANEEIRLGFISCGNRAGQLMGYFDKLDGVHIAGLCDPDQQRVDSTKQRFPGARTWTDLRGLLDDKNIDAVVIATCNHWHCLAAIWAMEAGKDVYVEKPLAHNQWEGRQTVAAAKKYGKICQVGTQQRSDPMQAEIKTFLHEEKTLGPIQAVRVNRYGVRAPIGKRATPLTISDGVSKNLWLGPAQDEPIYRDQLHYDWHWDWNTGSGEMGNWGVHVLDDVRNNVFLDKVTLPKRIIGGGGRVAWNDAGQTPNVHFVYFDTGTIPVVIGLANLASKPGSSDRAQHPGPNSGYIAYCEGGRFEGQRGKATAFDNDGRVVKKFSGQKGNVIHQQNFIAAVRRRDPSILNASVEVGHHSTGWCNLANVTAKVGHPFSFAEIQQVRQGEQVWATVLQEMEKLLAAHQIAMETAEIRLSPMLQFDPRQETFIGPHAEQANRHLAREFRKPFVVPQIVA